MHDLITEPLITVRNKDKELGMTLPQVLAACARDEVEDFPHLRAHQEHPWHALLAQLSAIAAVNAGLDEMPVEQEAWSLMLRDLTKDEFPDGEPWHLVIEDQSKPAFLQPPNGNPRFTRRYPTEVSPDAMDVTFGSRRHETKDGTIVRPEPDHWLYALTAVQTANGLTGRSLYQVSRMNGGYANRHGFSVTPSTRWGRHITRDATVLTRHCQGAAVKHLLLWTHPWEGWKDEFIRMKDVHPHELYIEVCRRLRLFHDAAGTIRNARGTSRSPRTDSKGQFGKVSDPWTLTQTKTATTVTEFGFTCRATSGYLDPARNTLPLLAHHHPEVDGEGPIYLVARTLSRGQGKTSGYHTLTVPMNKTMATMLDGAARQERLAAAAKKRIEIIAELEKITTAAIRSYTSVNTKAVYAESDRLEEELAATYWQDLQRELEADDPQEELHQWARSTAVPAARRILRQAQQRFPTGTKDKYLGITTSDDIFWGMIRNSKIVPAPKTDEEGQEEA